MAKTHAEIISDLKKGRDSIIDALTVNGAVEELEIRGRRVKRRNFRQELMDIEQLITYFENQSAGKPTGPARTIAQIKYK